MHTDSSQPLVISVEYSYSFQIEVGVEIKENREKYRQ